MPATARRGRPHKGSGEPAAEALELRFRALDGAVEELHARFDDWEADGVFRGSLDLFGRQVLRLAVHEWLANLVQHATFGRRRPDIAVRLGKQADGVTCVVTDNSAGFDFQHQVLTQERILGGGQPSERGRGLLMLIACTDDLTYSPEDGRQRLSFRVRRGDPSEGRMVSLFQMPRPK